MPAPRLLTPRQIIITGGGAYILITSTPGATLTCGADSYTLGSAETSHAFEVDTGTYACSAALTGYTTASQNVTVADGVTEITLRPYLLPAEYQQVQYISSDGIAYIQSALLRFSSSNKVKLGVIINHFFGSANNNCYYVFGTGGYLQFAYWDGMVSVGNANASYSWTVGESYEIEFINKVLYVNNVTTGLSRNPNTSNNYLFWNGETGYGYPKNGTVLYWQKYDSSDNLIVNLLPCYRKVDSVPGLYDTIGNTFLVNSNSRGTFICGEDVN